MSKHTASLHWVLEPTADFPHGRFSRNHSITFDGGASIAASASPHVVGKWAAPSAIDPEEMLIAALSSCHMMSFLHAARLAGFTVASYRDTAEGLMELISPAKQAITKVVLHPQIEWTGPIPEQAQLDALHHQAHELCYIANSVRTEVTVASGPVA